MKQEIRIIGGLYRGKKIHFPALSELRPTPDRIRETLFNWLMNDIREARCLDAFAGSGALGLEAFSRGASKVVFLEQKPLIHTHLKKTLATFNSPNLHLLNTDANLYFQQNHEPFDIIFLDPPFAQNCIPDCLAGIVSHHLIHPAGLVYIESAEPIEADSRHWHRLKAKKAGQVYYGLLSRLPTIS